MKITRVAIAPLVLLLSSTVMPPAIAQVNWGGMPNAQLNDSRHTFQHKNTGCGEC
jgi:hypothetical protein